MREHEEVYKRVGNEEYIIKTVVRPSDTMADLKWFCRSRPYHGSTIYKVVYESREQAIPLIKGRIKASDIWAQSVANIKSEIEDFISKKQAAEELKKKEQQKKLEADEKLDELNKESN